MAGGIGTLTLKGEGLWQVAKRSLKEGGARKTNGPITNADIVARSNQIRKNSNLKSDVLQPNQNLVITPNTPRNPRLA